MKTSLKIFFLVFALAAFTGCSAQKRAERHVRKAVELWPELVQVKAHPIDTLLHTPSWTDEALFRIPKLATGETTYAATDHGTVVVRLSQSDSSLRVGFVAAPQPVRYKDTLRYREIQPVTLQPAKAEKSHFWEDFALWVFGLGMGFAAAIWFLSKMIKK